LKNIIGTILKIKCPNCNSTAKYSIHPANTEYIRCKYCGNIIDME